MNWPPSRCSCEAHEKRRLVKEKTLRMPWSDRKKKTAKLLITLAWAEPLLYFIIVALFTGEPPVVGGVEFESAYAAGAIALGVLHLVVAILVAIVVAAVIAILSVISAYTWIDSR